MIPDRPAWRTTDAVIPKSRNSPRLALINPSARLSAEDARSLPSLPSQSSVGINDSEQSGTDRVPDAVRAAGAFGYGLRRAVRATLSCAGK